MVSSKLKICKIETKPFAKYCIMRGVDYLGVHVLAFTLDEHMRELCDYIRAKGGRAILLTKERDTERLRQLIAYYRPWGVQLHYEVSATELVIMRGRLRVPLIPVFTDEMDEQAVRQLVEVGEFAIYDTSFRGGTGLVHAARHIGTFDDSLRQKVLLAGGVDLDVVKEMRGKVGGFDVQSYCRINHKAHYGRLEQLVCAVKGPPRRKVSVSLTDFNQKMGKPSFVDTEALEYQLDFSEGNLYSKFKVATRHVDQLLAQEDAPFTLHIFEKSPESFQRVIDYYWQLAASKLVRINIQYSPGLNLDAITTYDAQPCISLYYDDIGLYEAAYPKLHKCLSLILPSDLPRKQQYLRSHKDLLHRIAQKEVWFDRKVDEATIREVLQYDTAANFIVGRFVISNWSNEARLIRILKDTRSAI